MLYFIVLLYQLGREGIGIDKYFMYNIANKISRLKSFKRQDLKVKDESIKDTLIDLINYVAILKVYYENEKK